MAFYLPPQVDIFPHPLMAEEDGLLAIGGQTSVSNILLAYQFGIFPWNSEDDPLLWWYTHPRCVLFPQKLHISKSMRTYLNNNKFRISINNCFETVIQECRYSERNGQEGTWITDDILEVFLELNNKGHAHSVEVWADNELVGGLYGLAIGKIFYGESMFSRVNNASKFGFIKLVQLLTKNKFLLIDCQQETEHLISMGAEMISSISFYKYLKSNIFNHDVSNNWTFD